jgi:hypothetical protein
MAHTAYPSEFPLECISSLIQIGRGGFDEIIARKAEVGLHAWNIQGYGQSILLGSPDGPFTATNEAEEANFAEQANELVAVYQSAMGERSPQAFAAVGRFERRIDWLKLLAFLKEILPLILPFII